MRTMIAVPCMDMVHTDFMRSALSLQHRDETQFYFSQASLVYDGRNKLAEAAISGKFDRVLWLDSDMRFEPELAEQLHADLDEGREFVSALYFSRKPPITPVIYKEITSDVIDGQHSAPADRTILQNFCFHQLKAAKGIAQENQTQHWHAILIGRQLGTLTQKVSRFPEFRFQFSNVDRSHITAPPLEANP